MPCSAIYLDRRRRSFSISDVVRAAISWPFASSAMSPSASTALRTSYKWLVLIRVVRYCIRTFSISISRTSISTASSPTPPSFTSRAKSYRAFSASCGKASYRAACCSARIPTVPTPRAGRATLLFVSRPEDLAAFHRGCRLHRARALLPASRPTPPSPTMAGLGVAQASPARFAPHTACRMIDTDTYIQRLIDSDPLREPLLRSMIEALRLAKGSRGLDAGCGIGLQALLLAEEIGPAGHVTGLDLAPEFLQYAGEMVKGLDRAERISFRQGDVSNLPFEDDTFDWVWSADCVGYPVGDLLPLLRELARVVKPGGTVALRPGLLSVCFPDFLCWKPG